MDKESAYLLQLIDCNCNDCGFLVRDAERKKASNEFNLKEQQRHYLRKNGNLVKFQFQNSCKLQYGKCTKLNKDVVFTPATCQIHTQECFKHRKDT